MIDTTTYMRSSHNGTMRTWSSAYVIQLAAVLLCMSSERPRSFITGLCAPNVAASVGCTEMSADVRMGHQGASCAASSAWRHLHCCTFPCVVMCMAKGSSASKHAALHHLCGGTCRELTLWST
jgi:hypothetical protein